MLVGKQLSLGAMLEMFEALASLAIAELSNEKLFVHAGVVAWQGKAIVFPEKSHSGKSSLVAELVKCGATYYSDEFALVDENGCVTPYPEPLSMRKPGEQRQTSVSVEKIGGIIGTASLPVGLVVVGHYEMGARWKPQTLSCGIGLLSLLENTHSAQRTPGRALQILQNVVQSALIVTGARGEASEAAPKILREVPL
jgi:hypothetical protein